MNAWPALGWFVPPPTRSALPSSTRQCADRRPSRDVVDGAASTTAVPHALDRQPAPDEPLDELVPHHALEGDRASACGDFARQHRRTT
jgi:hypothetical protein